MRELAFDKLGFKIDGKDGYLVSGEFHYFRVPHADWRRRMELFRDAGGNCLATYVPWLIHEPTEGDIRFGDVEQRDLCGFLDTAREVGLKVLLRPGPYQYSELEYSGLPGWLFDNYPQVTARNIADEPFCGMSISYLHPIVLEKARKYYKAFADIVRPYMAENGGPVSMLQVDNELMGIHIWFGSLDYNRDTMGFGRADGRYPNWLRAKYSDISALNAAYKASYSTFADVFPIDRADENDVHACRIVRDYYEFYLATIAEYASLLASWLREYGLNAPICHNSANPNMNCLFPELVDAMAAGGVPHAGVLLGSDHYYTLGQSWAQNNPTPQYALRVMLSCDTLRAMGMPPVAFELPGGSPSDTPPILPEDLLACYMTNLALGLKGVNYYVYTGGPNFPDTGSTCDIYDYNAHVHADGSLNATYASLKAFGDYMRANAWLQRADRVASVQVGYEWNTLRCNGFDYAGLPYGGVNAGEFLEKGILYTLMCSKYSPEMVLLAQSNHVPVKLDVSRPLIVPCPSAMSAASQTALIDFLSRGGQLLMLPVLPETDLEYNPCTLLRDFIYGDSAAAARAFERASTPGKVTAGPATCVEGAGRVFGINAVAACCELPHGAHIIATDGRSGRTLGFELPIESAAEGAPAGCVTWLGGAWDMSTFDQPRMLEHMLGHMGGKPCVESSNRNIFTALWSDDSGRRELFAMNLYSGAQSTDITVLMGGRCELGSISLKPMEVKSIALPLEGGHA